MVLADALTPVHQIGREIRIELATVIGASPFGQLQQRIRQQPTLLAEQRAASPVSIQRQMADAFLQSVRAGAVRR